MNGASHNLRPVLLSPPSSSSSPCGSSSTMTTISTLSSQMRTTKIISTRGRWKFIVFVVVAWSLVMVQFVTDVANLATFSFGGVLSKPMQQQKHLSQQEVQQRLHPSKQSKQQQPQHFQQQDDKLLLDGKLSNRYLRPRVVLVSSSFYEPLSSLSTSQTITKRRTVWEEKQTVWWRKHEPTDSNDKLIKPARQIYSVSPAYRNRSSSSSLPSNPTTMAGNCQPQKKWQMHSYPTCNTMHERDLYSVDVRYLGQGSIRSVWKMTTPSTHSHGTSNKINLVLKTLRYSGRGVDFDPSHYESHRRDAMASERLTSSPHVVDVYGYCGQSCINERLSSNLQKFKKMKPKAMERLRIARDAAKALADVHGVDTGTVGATIVHRDVTHRNFLMTTIDDHGHAASSVGTVHLNDFNVARFIEWDPKVNQTCGFRKFDCGPYRSPEECRNDVLTEKIDVYSLGNTFYYLLTNLQPYRYPEKPSKRTVRKLIINGTTSIIPTRYYESKDPAIKVMMDMIKQCWMYNPTDRPTAREIVNELSSALKSLSKGRKSNS